MMIAPLDPVPQVAVVLPQDCPVYATARTANYEWFFTAGKDGRISRFDTRASFAGRSLLTQAQRCGLPDSVVRAGHLLGYFYARRDPPALYPPRPPALLQSVGASEHLCDKMMALSTCATLYYVPRSSTTSTAKVGNCPPTNFYTAQCPHDHPQLQDIHQPTRASSVPASVSTAQERGSAVVSMTQPNATTGRYGPAPVDPKERYVSCCISDATLESRIRHGDSYADAASDASPTKRNLGDQSKMCRNFAGESDADFAVNDAAADDRFSNAAHEPKIANDLDENALMSDSDASSNEVDRDDTGSSNQKTYGAERLSRRSRRRMPRRLSVTTSCSLADYKLPTAREAVHSLVVERSALWAIAGTISGAARMYSVRADEGTLIATFRPPKHMPAPAAAATLDVSVPTAPSLAMRLGTSATGTDTGTSAGATASSSSSAVLQFGSVGEDPVSALELNALETEVAIGAGRGYAAVWDLDYGCEVALCNSLVGTAPITTIRRAPLSDRLRLVLSLNGSAVLWDARLAPALGGILPLLKAAGTPPWAVTADFSGDGLAIYIGRRTGVVDEYDVRMCGPRSQVEDPNPGISSNHAPGGLRLPREAGPVWALRSMTRSVVVVGASDGIRLWHPRHTGKGLSFAVVPGHCGGPISSIDVDNNLMYMAVSSGSRGWAANPTREAAQCLLYEIGNGQLHRSADSLG